jgi:hypothetical protein
MGQSAIRRGYTNKIAVEEVVAVEIGEISG